MSILSNPSAIADEGHLASHRGARLSRLSRRWATTGAALLRKALPSGDAVLGFCAVSCAIASVAFLGLVVRTSVENPGYFDSLVLSRMRPALDPITTGGTASDDGIINGIRTLPIPKTVRKKPLDPGDFQIVMVFSHEAILATQDALWRVKAGSVVPGLGEILRIETVGGAETVHASEATLRRVMR